MSERMIHLILLSLLVLSGTACEPYSDPSSTSIPSGPAEEWRGTYEGSCLLTCDALGVYEREMAATLRVNPAGSEVNIELFLVPDLAYSPKFRVTGPVSSESSIGFHIARDSEFIFHAGLGKSRNHVGGSIWVTNLTTHIYWQVLNLDVDR